MNKRFRPCSLDQPFVLPPSLQDWLPEDHLARFLAQVVDELDLSAVYQAYQRKDGRGLAAYHPLMLTRLLLYAYCVGLPSSRKIEKATHEDLAFRYLAANQHPDHDTIATFRQQHLEQLAGLFVQALKLCRQAGLVKLGRVAIDGTKIQANASRRKSQKYQKLQEQEQELQAKVEGLLRQAEEADAREDAQYGKGVRGDELLAELATAERRLKKLRAAKEELQREAYEKAEQAERERQERGERKPTGAEKKRQQRAKGGKPKPEAQANLTDPESRVMKDSGRGCFVQAYNAQVAVEAEHQLIVAAAVTQQPADKQQLVPMVERVQQTTGETPEAVLADAGYWSEGAVRDEKLKGIELLVSPDGGRGKSAVASNAPQSETAQRMREKLQSSEGRGLYRLRKTIVEPVFGYIKQQRGLRRFLLRGLRKVNGEWLLICLTHNLLKLFKIRQEVGGLWAVAV